MSLMMTGYIRMLGAHAANNEPVDEHADRSLALIPASRLADFEAMLVAPDWLNRLTAISPTVAHHPAWFTTLRNTMLEYIKEDREAGQGLTDTGDTSNVTSHETTNSESASNNHTPGNTA